MLSRRRNSMHPYGRASSPERKSSSNLGSTFGGFGKGKSKERDTTGSPSPRPASPLRRISSTPRASDVSSSPKQTRQPNSDRPNGTVPEPTEDAGPSSGVVNGSIQESIPELKEPMPPPPSSEPQPEVNTLHYRKEDEADSRTAPEGRRRIQCTLFSQRCNHRGGTRSGTVSKTPSLFAIFDTDSSSSPIDTNPAPQFKLDIKNAPIQEEDGDPNAAMADMANTLRAVCDPSAIASCLTVYSKLHRRDVLAPYGDDGTFAIRSSYPIPQLLSSQVSGICHLSHLLVLAPVRRASQLLLFHHSRLLQPSSSPTELWLRRITPHLIRSPFGPGGHSAVRPARQ